MAEFLEALAIVTIVAIGVLAGMAVLVVVAARRALRRVRRRVYALWTGQPSDVRPARLSWQASRERRELWRAVRTATDAVGRAVRAQAPVGDLPWLAARLHAAARQVDHGVVVAGAARGPLPPSVTAQVRDIEQAAGRLHAAAVAVTADLALPETRSLLSDIDLESRALATGMARWRAVG